MAYLDYIGQRVVYCLGLQLGYPTTASLLSQSEFFHIFANCKGCHSCVGGLLLSPLCDLTRNPPERLSTHNEKLCLNYIARMKETAYVGKSDTDMSLLYFCFSNCASHPPTSPSR
jgi:hypothetical protein